MSASFELQIEHATFSIGGRPLEVVAVDGHEAVSHLFRFAVTCAVPGAIPTPESLIAKEAELVLRDGYRGERRITGLVAEASIEVSDDGGAELVAVLRPKVFPLTLGSDCCSFQEVDVIDVVKDVLASATTAKMPVRYELVSSYPKRPYIAQYREDDWTFLSRLLEEEGIYYWFDHAADETTLVFCEHSSSAPEVTGGAYISFAYETGMTSGMELIEEIGSAVKATPTKFTVGSFDPNRPLFKVTATEGQGPLEHYDAPGGGPESPAVVSARARTMREAAAAAREGVMGQANSARLVPGMIFELGGHPIARLDGRYFITSSRVTVEQRRRNAGQAARAFVSHFSAIQEKTPFRPPAETKKGKQAGLQLGVVIGAPGEEIHSDPTGRVRVQLHWDRFGKRDHTAGKWMRVAQRATPGSMLLPRMGWNVATFNEEGTVDAPHILSRIHDAEHPPAYELPANKTRVVWKTATTPGGGSFNEIYFEDKKGAEEMFINASKDMNVFVTNLKNEFVHNDSTRKVGQNHMIQIADLASETIGGNQTVNIGGVETVKSMAGRNKTVGASESISIGGSRNLKVGSSHVTNVSKNRSLSVGAAMIDTTLGNVSNTSQIASVLVGGVVLKVSAASITEDVGTIGLQTIGGLKFESAKKASALEVQKKYKERVLGIMALETKGKYIDNAETTSTWTVGGELSGEAPEIWVEAIKEIRIKCGDSVIRILPDAISFKAKSIDLSGAHIQAMTKAIDHN
ncbi:MAG: type VI secretion system tip protein TssI/VgrG [Byssovorax sp.]